LLAAFAPLLRAQSGRVTETNAAGWYTYSGDHPISGPWGAHIEAQVRRNHIVTEWERLQFRNGLNYRINDSTVLTAGHVCTRKFPTGEFSPSTGEQRIYEQATFSQDAGDWTLSHLVRFEQVFTEGPYENRFRYGLRPRRPLSRNYFLQLSVEPQVRFGFNYKGRAFYQLRLYSAIGRKLSRYWSVEAGYLYQYIVPRFGPVYESNQVLRVTVSSSVPF
jgi:hypothetical protein